MHLKIRPLKYDINIYNLTFDHKHAQSIVLYQTEPLSCEYHTRRPTCLRSWRLGRTAFDCSCSKEQTNCTRAKCGTSIA